MVNSKKNSSKKSDNFDQKGFQWKQAGKTSLIWIMIISVAIYLSAMFTDNAKKEPVLQYSQYRDFLYNHQNIRKFLLPLTETSYVFVFLNYLSPFYQVQNNTFLVDKTHHSQ